MEGINQSINQSIKEFLSIKELIDRLL
jgi:hypothetical protein